MNAVAAYLADHRERLDLERRGVPERPSCVLVAPRFRESRHIIVLVLGKDDRGPALVAKLPRLPGASGLAREAANLRAADRALGGRDVGTVPSLVAFEAPTDYPILLETGLAGRALSPRAVRRDRERLVADACAWLVRLARATAHRPPDGDWYERLVAAPLRALGRRPADGALLRPVVERTLESAAALHDAEIPLVLEHGDLCHPNLLRQPDGRLGVLDWERADPSGLPGHDLVFVLAYVAASGRAGPAGVPAAFFGPDAWARPVLEGYARALGLDPGLVPALIAVACARAIAAVGAPSASSPVPDARDAAARHLPLWRHAVGLA